MFRIEEGGPASRRSRAHALWGRVLRRRRPNQNNSLLIHLCRPNNTKWPNFCNTHHICGPLGIPPLRVLELDCCRLGVKALLQISPSDSRSCVPNPRSVRGGGGLSVAALRSAWLGRLPRPSQHRSSQELSSRSRLLRPAAAAPGLEAGAAKRHRATVPPRRPERRGANSGTVAAEQVRILCL